MIGREKGRERRQQSLRITRVGLDEHFYPKTVINKEKRMTFAFNLFNNIN